MVLRIPLQALVWNDDGNKNKNKNKNKYKNDEPIDIKRKYRLLKVCYVPTTSAAFFFAAASNSTNETNKAGGTCH
jgi:hypothetical protein